MESKAGTPLSRRIGYILLVPPLLSVLALLIQLTDRSANLLKEVRSEQWIGDYSSGGGAASSLPIYFGLMALAGAYLIRRD